MSNVLLGYLGAEELGLDTAAVAEEVAEVAAEAVRAEVAELAVEIEENSAQVEELVEEVQELEEVVEEVAENVEGMESLLGSGQYNSAAFATLYNRTNRLCARLGGADAGSRLGAESIADASTAEMMARDGLESFMETAKRWGKKAIEFIKHIFNTVVNFFVGLINQAAAIQRRAEQLKKRINDGSSIKKDVKAGNWGLWLGRTEVASKGLFGMFNVNAEKSVDGLIDSVGTSPSDVKVDKFKSALESLINTLEKSVKTGDSAKTSDGETVIALFGGGIRVIATTPKMGDAKTASELAAVTRKVGLTYSVDPDAKKKIVGEKVADMTADQLSKECDTAIEAATQMKKKKVEAKFSNAQRDKLIGNINAIYAKPGDDGEETRKDIRAKVQIVQAAYATGAKLTSVYGKLMSKAAVARLDRVSAFLAYGKDAEDK